MASAAYAGKAAATAAARNVIVFIFAYVCGDDRMVDCV